MRERRPQIIARLGPPVGLGLVLGVIGPFGTFDLLNPLPRMGYWLVVVSLNWLVADIIVRRVDATSGARLPMPSVFVPSIGAVVAAFPATGMVALANGLSGIGWPEDVPHLFGQVLLLLAAIALPVYAWEDMREKVTAQRDPILPKASRLPHAGDDRGQDGDPSIFMARLPKPLKGPLLCLEMQDHYLILHYTGGSTMILCRMEDAARELGGLGRRVHRSWWVATAAVAGSEREGQRTFLRLINDRRIPVGRSFRHELKQNGWL